MRRPSGDAPPEVHAARDIRNRLWIPDGCDINVMVEVEVEGRSFPWNHVIRGADRRTPDDLGTELQRTKKDPESSPTASLERTARWFFRLPSRLRVSLIGMVRRFPATQRRLTGTIGVTAVGIFGEDGGYGIAFRSTRSTSCSEVSKPVPTPDPTGSGNCWTSR